MKILLATTNKKKIEEFNQMFKTIDIKFISLKDLNIDIESPEDHQTFKENALQKAKFYHEMTNMPVISDDSGIEVFELDNFPGVNSKRWMGDEDYEQKVNKLLEMLDGKDNSCQYKAAIAYVDKDQSIAFEGMVEGKLVKPDMSNPNAFGYDIGFYYEDKKDVFANLSLEFKNTISHRHRALEKFLNWYKNQK